MPHLKSEVIDRTSLSDWQRELSLKLPILGWTWKRITGIYTKRKALIWSNTTGLRAGSEIPNTLLELGTRHNFHLDIRPFFFFFFFCLVSLSPFYPHSYFLHLSSLLFSFSCLG